MYAAGEIIRFGAALEQLATAINHVLHPLDALTAAGSKIGLIYDFATDLTDAFSGKLIISEIELQKQKSAFDDTAAAVDRYIAQFNEAAEKISDSLSGPKEIQPPAAATPEQLAAQRHLLEEQKHQLEQQFAAFIAEQREEIAAAGDTTAAKISHMQEVVEWAKDHFGEQSKQYQQALTQELNAERENVAQLKALYVQQTADIAEEKAKQLEVAKSVYEEQFKAGQITRQQELGDEANVTQQIYALKLGALEKERSLYQEGSKEYERYTKEIVDAELDLQKQLNDLGGQIAEDSRRNAEQSARAWDSALRPLESGFNGLVNDLTSGNKTITQSFLRMFEDIAKGLISSGLKDLFFGTARDQSGNQAFGGLSGLLQSFFSGPPQSRSQTNPALGGINSSQVQQVFGSAFQAIKGIVQNVFGGAFQGISGLLRTLFGSLFGGGATQGGALPGLSQASVQSSFSSAFQGIQGTVQSVFGSSFSGISGLLQSIFGSIFGGLLGGGGTGGGLGSLTSFLPLLLAPLGFESGGIVPSAAGGMVMGGRASLALLHPREMVLPAPISESIQRMTNNGDEGGGGHTFNFHVSAIDARGVDELLKSRRGVFEKMIRDGLRGGK